MTPFGKALEHKCAAAGISLSKLAERTKIPLTKLRYWQISPAKNMWAAEAYEISIVLNWPVDEMVSLIMRVQ